MSKKDSLQGVLAHRHERIDASYARDLCLASLQQVFA